LQSENVAFGVLVALAFRNLNRGDRFGLLGAVGFVSEVDETSL
jgi:hypothetical protein